MSGWANGPSSGRGSSAISRLRIHAGAVGCAGSVARGRCSSTPPRAAMILYYPGGYGSLLRGLRGGGEEGPLTPPDDADFSLCCQCAAASEGMLDRFPASG